MKKQILLIALIAISSVTIAQIKPSFGIRGGLSYAGMRGDAVNSLKNMLDFADGMIATGNRTGFFAGTYATIPLNDLISVDPALYYTQKGYELRGSFNIKGAGFLGANARAQLTSQYIDLPVLLKARKGGFELFAGPQVSYLAHSNLNIRAGALGINFLNNQTNVLKQFNQWDIAATVGLGYRLGNGVNVMASYDHGLSKADANRNLNSYNRSFKVGLGMTF